jgi:phosphoglycerate dehydrogenase-like enzyme
MKVMPTPAETKLLICVWYHFTLWRPPGDVAVQIRARFPQMNVVHLPNYDHLDAELPDTNIFVGWSLKPQQFALARKLQWIHATAAGVNQLMYPELRASTVAVTNASGVHSIPMAEHILGTIIALARRFPSAMRYQAQRRWAQQEIWDEPIRPRELPGQVLLLVGFGAIGRELARRVRPLGMKIWACTRSGRSDSPDLDCIVPARELDAVLHEADFVVLAAPDTPDTHQLMNAQRLALMKPTAFLINVARGSLVDEAALLAALRSRAIAGAALDVAEREPLPADHPLWALDNVFITPHISSVSEYLWDRQTELLLDNLDRWFSGRELRNRVDLSRGY